MCISYKLSNDRKYYDNQHFISAFKLKLNPLKLYPTVNSEIFARVLFSRNFAAEKFRETKTLAKWLKHSAVY